MAGTAKATLKPPAIKPLTKAQELGRTESSSQDRSIPPSSETVRR